MYCAATLEMPARMPACRVDRTSTESMLCLRVNVVGRSGCRRCGVWCLGLDRTTSRRIMTCFVDDYPGEVDYLFLEITPTCPRPFHSNFFSRAGA